MIYPSKFWCPHPHQKVTSGSAAPPLVGSYRPFGAATGGMSDVGRYAGWARDFSENLTLETLR